MDRDVLVLSAPKTKRDLFTCLAQLVLFVVVCVIGSSVLINVGRAAVEHARLSGGNMLKRHEAARIAVWTSWSVNTTPWLLGNGTCLRCPRCLDPPQRCLSYRDLVFPILPECFMRGGSSPTVARILCARAMWRCPGTGVLVSLPRITDTEMSALYSSHYGGQANLAGPNNSRSLGQAADIRRALGHRSGGGSGLHLVEIGCASGYVLYNLRDLAADGGSLTCFEPDPHYHERLGRTFAAVHATTRGVRTRLVRSLFTPGALPPGSVDAFTSSHVLEHLADPCDWLAETYRVLRPGGVLFTELPTQYYKPHAVAPPAESGSAAARDVAARTRAWLGISPGTRYPGMFHVTLYGSPGGNATTARNARVDSPFEAMLRHGGFEPIAGEPYASRRYIWRKPMRRNLNAYLRNVSARAQRCHHRRTP